MYIDMDTIIIIDVTDTMKGERGEVKMYLFN